MDALLRGSWAFHRRLLHASGDALEVSGRASWTPLAGAAAAALAYEERGRMTRAGGALVAEVRQAHTWRLRRSEGDGGADGAGGTGGAGGHDVADVHFEDGRFFHSVALQWPPPGGGARASCAVAHDCAPDTYTGEWAVVAGAAAGAPVSLECEWRVSGPAKSYCSTTRFWRDALSPLSSSLSSSAAAPQ